MSILQEAAVKNLRELRSELLATQKQNLTFAILVAWHSKSRDAILAAGQVLGSPASTWNPMSQRLHGYAKTTDPDILDAIRDGLVESIDSMITAVDSKQTVRPVLDELILKIKDTKLSTLLKEFNASKDLQPNLAAIGFRTILCLVIIEIAKLRNPSSKLASREDLALDPIIQQALDEKAFDDGESRLVERFRGGSKVKLDIVAHKPGDKSLVDKDDLSSAVDTLLNHLLKAL
jgi:hypothetical protein